MSTKYKATTTNEAFFITITATAWIDVLLRREQKELIARSLDHCQKEKGLEIYTYVIMSSHIHVFCKAAGVQPLCDIIRDFKTFTSNMILRNVIDQPESRREWMLDFFQKSCSQLKRNQHYKVWQDGYHAEIIYSNAFIITLVRQGIMRGLKTSLK